ncbi:XRE family transcriptional regulator [Bifidobacterium pseudocatenulatum]|nr:XRE family transcriptional regulator [Bifidobacterium pseudocatenulatum]
MRNGVAISRADVAVSSYLKQLRLSRGLSQNALAERLGESQSFISKYENAQRKLTIIEFVHVVRALDAVPSEVISEMDERII